VLLHCRNIRQEIGNPDPDARFYPAVSEFSTVQTRNQAVARTADRTASQHLWGSRDVIVG